MTDWDQTPGNDSISTSFAGEWVDFRYQVESGTVKAKV